MGGFGGGGGGLITFVVDCKQKMMLSCEVWYMLMAVEVGVQWRKKLVVKHVIHSKSEWTKKWTKDERKR